MAASGWGPDPRNPPSDARLDKKTSRASRCPASGCLASGCSEAGCSEAEEAGVRWLWRAPRARETA
jgi:hypothetical protein